MILSYRYYCCILLTAGFVIGSPAVRAADNGTTIFYRYTIEEGLSFNTVNNIDQDYQGFIWISTDNGLNRFDGRSFVIYHKNGEPGGLSNNRIFRTFEDSDSTLWICTGRGLNIYNRDKDDFVTVSLPGIDADKGESVIADIAEDKKGLIWILTVSDLIFYDKSKNKYRNVNIPLEYPDYQFTKIFVESDSTLWMGVTGKGLMIYNIKTGRISYKYGDKFPAGVKEFVRDRNGDIYIVANEGILRINSETGEENWHAFLLSDMRTRAYEAWDMIIDHSGKLWIGTDNCGVQIADKNLRIKSSIMNRPGNPYSLSGNNIRCLFEDRDNNIWIGTLNNGLMFMPNSQTRYYTPYIPTCNEDGQCIKTMTSICETASGDIWLGSDGSGLFRYNPHTGIYANYQYIEGDPKSISANTILDILPVDKNHLLLATYNGGFGEFNIAKGSFERIPLKSSVTHRNVLSIRDLNFDKQGNLWIATLKDGLIKYSLKARKVLKTYIHYPGNSSSLTDNYCLKVIQDRKGELWIATYYGLSKFDPVSEKFTNYHYREKDTASLSNDWVYALCEDKRGRIWAGTLDGLCLYQPGNDNFRRYPIRININSNTINGILADSNDNLWLSTNKGIVVFDPVSRRFFSFSSDDGLPGNIFLHGSYYKGPTGKLYFGATFGAISFSPDKITIDSSTPDVVLTGLILDYKPVPIQSAENPGSPLKKNISVIKQLKIPYRNRQIGFDFIGINYKAPLTTRYAYMLDGFDKDWNYIGRETNVSFNNLAPGKYRLRIKASNKFGYWDDKEQSVELIVIPPWWRTVWFYFILGAIIIGLIVLIIIARERNLRKYSRLLETRVRERTSEITKQNEEIKRQSREILDQKQHIEYQSSQLEEKTIILEEQAEELKTANEQLRESNSTKDRFFSIIAHDLKNPFGTLLGFIELIEENYDEFDDERKKNLLKIIAASSKNVYNLLENLLHWSRAQRGIIEYRPEQISVKKIVEYTVDLFIPNFKEKNISCELDLYDENAEIYADENLTSTILRNLVSNAIKFTQKNGQVVISSRKKGKKVEICVQDNGVGISKSNIGKLFSIDQHITTYGTNDETGTGLGLILSKEFIMKQHGTIKVESKEGIGTIFRFTLPAQAHR